MKKIFKFTLRSLTIVKKYLFIIFVPKKLDMLLYKVDLDKVTQKSYSKIELEIIKTTNSRFINYEAFHDGQRVFIIKIYYSVFTLRQFGYKDHPTVGGIETKSEFRNFGIFKHCLNYILNDLKNNFKFYNVYGLIRPDNLPSIRGMERVGFEFVSRLKGIRVGPFIKKI